MNTNKIRCLLLALALLLCSFAALASCEHHDDSMTPYHDDNGEVLGCYDQESNTCDCDATDATCVGDSQFMTNLCSGFCSIPDAVPGCLQGQEDGDHLCSCAIPEASCTGDENLWTDACACMQGCFSQDTYMCDCDKTEDQCGSDGANEFWTPLCNDACMAKELGAAFTPGCLEFGEAGVHGCKCDVDEEQCKNNGNIWTDSCDCTVVPTYGCYNNDNGECDCMVSEEECGEKDSDSFWSGLCTEWCENELKGEDAAAVSAGCLVFEEDGTHECQCTIPESACNDEYNAANNVTRVWTESCVCYQGCYDEEQHTCDCDKDDDECIGETESQTSLCHEKCTNEKRHAAGCLTAGGEGSHGCDCSISESECTGDDIWTDACQCYVPGGCYDISIHQCDCSDTEEACLAQNDALALGDKQFYWTEDCIGTDGKDCGDLDQPLTGNAAGCFNFDLHLCNCDLSEDECKPENFPAPFNTADIQTIWTKTCECPSTPLVGPSRQFDFF